MRLDKSDLNTEVLVRVEQGVWSHEFTTFGNSTFVVPPGSVAMDVHLDGALLKEVTLREEMHDIMLPINTYTLDILRGDNAIIDTERIEVKWSGSDWIDMTEVGVTGPSNEDWDARISYKGWYFERVMTIPTVNTEAKIWVEIANVSLDVLDRNGDSLKETSCTFTGPEGMMTVVTDTTTSNFELLSGNYAYSCRVPSAGEVEDDGRRSSKEFTGDLIATADGSNKLVIDVVELPFSESEQVKGILSSGVGLTIGIIALIGWAIALFSMNKISNLKREKEETGEFISESTVPSAPTQAAPASEFDVDDLFD